jgi:hypothetical protein
VAILAVDEVMLREPRLLVPRLAPVGSVKLNDAIPQISNTKLIYCPGVAGTRNLAPTKGAGEAAGVVMPSTGTMTRSATPIGIADYGTATGDYILSGITPNTGEHLSTFLVVIAPRVGDSAATSRWFCTRYDATTASDYAGFYAYGTSAGAVAMEYGDGGVPNVANRRTLMTGNGAITFPGTFAIAGHFLTSTTGILYINGRQASLTSSGTGDVIAGTGNIHIHDIHGIASTAWVPILLLALFNEALPRSLVCDLSADPFQLFVPA